MGSGLPSTLHVNVASFPSLTVMSRGMIGNVGRRVTSFLRFGDGDLSASENAEKTKTEGCDLKIM